MEIKNGAMSFSCREFVEFTSAEEFERFRTLDPIAAEEVANVDWEELSKGLLG